jgi:hypothetical protein
VETVIVLSRDQASFYQFLKPRQDRVGRTLVILDRRDADLETASGNGAAENRRHAQPEAALALMSVLGFMVLHRDGDRWTV